MKIQTFTIVAGTADCNAKCPYCISKMTPKEGVSFLGPRINWRNFGRACRLAQVNNVSTVLITGKGEPTLYPEQLTKFLEEIRPFDFPIIELQTNGILFDKKFSDYKKYLEEWYRLGLTTIAISIVHYGKEKNKEIFTPNSEYIELERVTNELHELGYSVRLSCTLIKGYVDCSEELKKLIEYSQKLKIEQLSIRKLAIPLETENKEVLKWATEHMVSEENLKELNQFLEEKGHRLMTLQHGAIVYDVNGQNICLTDALTIKPETDELRQLIFFPDGHLRYDWQFGGAILI